MAYEFKLPDLGEGVAEGEIARWLVEVGQEIDEDDPLVEVQTDKTTVEIPSPAGGKVARILVAEGELVPVGTPLVVIGDGDVPAETAAAPAAPAAEEPAPSAEPSERVKATPLVRKIAAELGVDLALLAGTGPGGRITEEDVRRYASFAGGQAPDRARSDASPARRAAADRAAPDDLASGGSGGHRRRGVRLHGLAAARGERSYLPYLLQAVVGGLKEVPELNATLDGEEIVFWERYDLGLAVQTDEGLVVPVLRAADEKSLDELEAEARRLAEGARAGTLKPEELRGSTFTVTSAGKLGGLFATPLVNHPEVGILGLHRIGPRPAVVDGEIAVREIGWLACTFDHRVVDGARASVFLLDVIGRLQSPA